VNLYSLFVFIEHNGDESPKDYCYCFSFLLFSGVLIFSGANGGGIVIEIIADNNLLLVPD